MIDVFNLKLLLRDRHGITVLNDMEGPVDLNVINNHKKTMVALMSKYEADTTTGDLAATILEIMGMHGWTAFAFYHHDPEERKFRWGGM